MSKRKKLKALRVLALDLLIQRDLLVREYQEAANERDWATADLVGPRLDAVEAKIRRLVASHRLWMGN